VDNQSNEQLNTQLKNINATLQQLKNDLAQVMAEVKTMHAEMADLPTGEKWVPSR
jgi:phage shock protein A